MDRIPYQYFLIFSIAPTVIPYICTLLLASLITSRPGERPAWRTPSMVILAAAFFTEIWWTVQGTVHFREGKLDGWNQTHTYLVRHTVLLLLPVIVHNLPAYSSLSALPPFIEIPPSRPVLPHQSSDFHLSNSTPRSKTPQRSPSSPAVLTLDPQNQPPNTPVTALNGVLATFSNTLGALHVLEWTRIAGLRRHDLREQISDYFEADDQNATFARSDLVLRQEAERLGMSFHSQQPKRKGRTRLSDNERRRVGRGTFRPEGEKAEHDITSDEDGDSDRRTPDNRMSDEDENEALNNSPLRAKARQAAKDLTQNFIRRLGSLQPGNRKEEEVGKM
ncbi:hypothetical protein BU17DRAFT_65153 [Hysterangium stoloniferum]|nr:hypothetical protein BU17DRAFT_65153 [Hysterangium stoloniferum]